MSDDLAKPLGPHAEKLGVLHAPWRESYMQMLSAKDKDPASSRSDKQDANHAGKSGCFLRDYWLNPQQDNQNRVVLRTGEEQLNNGNGGMILLNAYPYINGHLLVALGESRSRLLDYDESERALLWSLVDLATELVEIALEPQGLNIGVNIGKAGGAGVPEHIHVHVMPRWAGDTNFSTTVAGIRVVSTSMDSIFDRYRQAWETIKQRPQ